jgi:uncharacterized protein YneR
MMMKNGIRFEVEYMKFFKISLLTVLFAIMIIIPLAAAQSSSPAYFRPSTGGWSFDFNFDGNSDKALAYGSSTDRIIVGDWNGDGKDGIAYFRPSTGYWYFDYNLDGIDNNYFRYGGSTDQITKGDWDGDGRDGIAIFRPSTGYWYFDYQLDGVVDRSFRYGGSTDRIIVGDWDGDERDGIAIFRPSTGYWYFDYQLDGVVDRSFRYGGSTDTIIKGDWDGDGRDGIAIFRPSTGYWYFDNNLDGTIDVSERFGGNGDIPVVGRWAVPALNVLAVKPGDPDYTSDAILNTAVVQRAMNYNPTNIDGYALNVRQTIRSLLLNDHILLINGHSQPGIIQVNKQNDEWYYGKKLLPGEYEFNEISSYANMTLAIFLGCNSGGSDFIHGNLVDVIGDKNGHCAMGWTKELNVNMAPYYNTQLWNQLQQSNSISILDAHSIATYIVENDGYCKYLHQTLPNQYNEFCNQDALYYRQNNQGCSLPLPRGMASQASSIPGQTMDGERPSDTIIEKSIESIHQFTNSPVTDIRYSGTTHETYADLYAFDTNHSSYWVNSVNDRVQAGIWFEMGSKDLKEIIDLDQGYSIAESFTREKYPEFWNTSDTRGTKIVTKNKLDRGGDRQLQYEWWEIYYTSNKNTTLYSEIPGLNSVSVTVNPYTGHVIGYSETYTPSVSTGIIPVDLTPALTNEQAEKIAIVHFQTLGVPDTQLTGPGSLGLRISTDQHNIAHLVWNFEMTRTQKIGPKDQEFEVKEYALVSVDAHEGTIIWSSPFG